MRRSTLKVCRSRYLGYRCQLARRHTLSTNTGLEDQSPSKGDERQRQYSFAPTLKLPLAGLDTRESDPARTDTSRLRSVSVTRYRPDRRAQTVNCSSCESYKRASSRITQPLWLHRKRSQLQNNILFLGRDRC